MPWHLIWPIYTGVAILILIWGVRGRRRGDTPHCPKCTFSLAGLAWAEGTLTCPECGRVIDESERIPRGERQFSPRAFSLSLAIIIIPTAVFVLFGSQTGWRFRIIEIVPTSILIDRLEAGRQTGLDATYDELWRRAAGGELAQDQYEAIAGIVLEGIESGVPPRQEPRGSPGEVLIRRAIEQGRLTPETLARAFRASYAVQARVPETVVQGRAIVPRFTQLDATSLRGRVLEGRMPRVNGEGWYPFEVIGASADGKPLPLTPDPGFSSRPVGFSGNAAYRPLATPTDRLPLADLSPGVHTIEWEVRVGPVTPRAWPTPPTSARPEFAARIQARLASRPPLATEEELINLGLPTRAWTQTIRAEITVLPESAVRRPEAIEVPPEASPILWSLHRRPARLTVILANTQGLPLGENEMTPYEVVLRAGDGETLLGYAATYAEGLVYQDPAGNYALLPGDEVENELAPVRGGVIILRTTRDAADRLAGTASVRVPLRELILSFGPDRLLTIVGEGEPNPLAEDYDLLDGVGVFLPDPPSDVGSD